MTNDWDVWAAGYPLSRYKSCHAEGREDPLLKTQEDCEVGVNSEA